MLKDAAAAAVYGSRAANGVILVQTKRAGDNQKVKINYRGQFNLQQSAKLPDFLNAYEFALLRNKAIENTPSSTLSPYTDEQLEEIRTHSNPNIYGNTDLLDYLDKTGYSTTHAISATGGNSFVKYYLSLGYANSKGLYSGVGRNRLNYSMKLDATLTKGLVLSVDYTGQTHAPRIPVTPPSMRHTVIRRSRYWSLRTAAWQVSTAATRSPTSTDWAVTLRISPR